MQAAPPPPVTTQEIRIVDAQGHPRIVLSAANGKPTITLLSQDAKPGTTVTLDAQDRPSIKLANPDVAGPSASLEIDDRGTHILFDRPGGASSYLFLNNAGMSGVVLIDAKGTRRTSIVVNGDGAVSVEGLPGPFAK